MTKSAILLAEDDENDAFLMQRVFRKLLLPHPLHVVSNGQHAINYLEGREDYADRSKFPLPMLLFLDLKMPIRNGFEVLEWRLNHSSFSRLPVIVLTSSTHNSDIVNAYQLGATSYLVKPSGIDELQDVISRFNSYWLQLNRWPQP